MTNETPHTVYLLFDGKEDCLYIGCSRQAGNRLHAHSSKEWWPRLAYAHFEHFDNRREALDRERELIRTLEPEFNRQYREPNTRQLDLVPDPGLAA